MDLRSSNLIINFCETLFLTPRLVNILFVIQKFFKHSFIMASESLYQFVYALVGRLLIASFKKLVFLSFLRLRFVFSLRRHIWIFIFLSVHLVINLFLCFSISFCFFIFSHCHFVSENMWVVFCYLLFVKMFRYRGNAFIEKFVEKSFIFESWNETTHPECWNKLFNSPPCPLPLLTLLSTLPWSYKLTFNKKNSEKKFKSRVFCCFYHVVGKNI